MAMLKAGILALILGSSAFAYADGLGSRIRFVQPKVFIETTTLPPTLKAVFDRQCNWEVIKVVREDQTLSSGKVVVNVGLLVTELDHACDGIYENEAVDAGVLFSGREYEVRPIVK